MLKIGTISRRSERLALDVFQNCFIFGRRACKGKFKRKVIDHIPTFSTPDTKTLTVCGVLLKKEADMKVGNLSHPSQT